MSEIVVFVHGLWMNGWDMTLLRRRVRRCGFDARQFSYPSTKKTVQENAAALQRFAQTLDAPAVHFVGHSLGGLVVLQLFQDFPAQRPGRVVLLGTPYSGCHAAQRLARYALWRRFLGCSLQGGLLGVRPAWRAQRELGVIAGTFPLGGGLWLGSVPRPNDGTVAVAETQVPGMAAHLTLPVSHMGLLISTATARQTCAFLKTGRFNSL